MGSDEAIDLLVRIFCRPNVDNILITPPTYGMYKVCAKVNDVAVKIAPLTPQFDVDIAALLRAIDANTRLLFLCSPGNPTSKIVPLETIQQVLAVYKTGLVVVDEAYIDFSGTESACSVLNQYPNLVVLQTLSKAFGLAGIRLGMAFSSSAIIQLMNNVKAPYNVNKLTAEVARQALSNRALYEVNKAIILAERDYLVEKISVLSIVKKVHVAQGNFVLFQVPKALQLYKHMADRGVVCRYRYFHLLSQDVSCWFCLCGLALSI